MSPQNNHLQRPPAAVLYADELAKLKQNDNAPCPPGWQLSLPAARAFILGDEAQNISRKVVISPSAVERMLVTLATGRGLMLVGEPGTAKSLLSELLATAISGDAGLTIQGGASTTENQVWLELRPAYQSWSVNGSAGPCPALSGNARRQNRPFRRDNAYTAGSAGLSVRYAF